MFARVGIDDSRRLVGRTTDLLVDETVLQIRELLPAVDPQLRALLDATRATAKIALRSAYEMGELMATRSVPANKTGQSVVSQRCVQIILEETQRYLLDRLMAAGLTELERGLRTMGLTEEDWDGLAPLRTQLGERLRHIPDDPFALSAQAVQFWENVVDDAIALFEELTGAADWADSWRASISILWSGAELMFAATRRMLNASDAAAAIELAPAALHAAFVGPVDSTAPTWVQDYVNSVLGRAPDDQIRREDLVVFLTEDIVFDLAVGAAPEIDRYLRIFESVFGDSRTFMRQALSNLGPIRFHDSGQIDATQTLGALVTPLKTFLQTSVQLQLAPAIRPHFRGRGDLMLYFDEVMLPSMSMAFDVAFDRALKWTSGTIDRQALSEALSSVVMTMLGRSLVVTSDVLVTAARAEIYQGFLNLAQSVDDPGGLADVLHQVAPSMDHDDIVEILQEVLEIGGEAFRPLPEPTRARIRELLYWVMGAAVSADPSSYAAALEDPLLMPGQQKTMQLAEEMGKIAVQSLSDFVWEMLRRVARMVLEEIEEQIQQFVEMVEGWVEAVHQAVVWARSKLQDLLQDVARLIQDLQRQLNELADQVQHLLGLFSQPTFRSSLKESIVKEILLPAETELNKNFVYTHVVPTEIKQFARDAMRTAVALAIDSPIAIPVWNALAAISFELNQLITSVRSFDPHAGIGGQLRDLIIREVEDMVRSAFGPDPGIDLKFSVSWTTPAFLLIPETTHNVEIDLGRIDLPVYDLVKVLRAFLEPLTALDAILQPLASTLAVMFQTEVEVAEKNEQADQVRVQVQNVERIETELREGVINTLDLVIVEPAPGGLYDTDITLRIDIAGAPLSFLGRFKGEQQRVLIWLNHKVMDIGVLQAHIIEPAPTWTTTATIPQRMSVAGLAPPSAIMATAPVRPEESPDMLFRGLETASMPEAGTATMPTPAVPSLPVSVMSAYTTLQLSQTNLAASTSSPAFTRAAAREQFIMSTVDDSNRITSLSSLKTVPVGSKPAPTDVQLLDTVPVPVLRLTGKIPLRSLNDGINSIVVAVADGMGRRIEKSASFIASRPLVGPAMGTDVMLPERMIAADLHLVKSGPRPQAPESMQNGTIYMSRAVRTASKQENTVAINNLRVASVVGL
ncbi:MAG: hypothetical protein AB7G88_11260 [Thermomicrobiales bacterium]